MHRVACKVQHAKRGIQHVEFNVQIVVCSVQRGPHCFKFSTPIMFFASCRKSDWFSTSRENGGVIVKRKKEKKGAG